MTFACKNYDQEQECCRKLGGECIPGRRGCVLDGQVVLSDALRKRVDELEKAKPLATRTPSRPPKKS